MRNWALVLLVALMVNIGWLASAQATETTWTRWGSCPYASDEEAIGKLPEALQAMSMPEPVKALFLEEVRRSPQGTTAYLNPGDRFEEMMSCGGRVMTDVVVGRNPVSRGIVQSAEAREWRVTYEGQTYVLVDPIICNNWAWRVMPASREVPAEEECTTVAVAVREGDVLAPAVFTGGTLFPSRCWAFKEGSGDWGAWPGGCEQCINWAPALARVSAADREVRMPGRVQIARSGTVWVRVPRQVEGEHYHLALILLRGGLCSYAVFHPSDWAEQHEHSISEGNWVWRQP